MENRSDLERMGRDIRIQGGQEEGKMTDLIFDPASGEFVTRSQGANINGNEVIVTGMTEGGFAKERV